MKIALVVGRRIQNSFTEDYFAIPVKLSTLLAESGFFPIFIGFEDGNIKEIFSRVQPSICILTGGDSLGENVPRDQFEYELLNIASTLKTPVIGICRGMQMMATSRGAELVISDSHAGTHHSVSGKSKFIINSYHNYVLRTCPIGFTVDLSALDGTIEAFSNHSLKWFGVMWHPEREAIGSEGYLYMTELLESL